MASENFASTLTDVKEEDMVDGHPTNTGPLS